MHAHDPTILSDDRSVESSSSVSLFAKIIKIVWGYFHPVNNFLIIMLTIKKTTLQGDVTRLSAKTKSFAVRQVHCC